jgi:hypothetical protein
MRLTLITGTPSLLFGGGFFALKVGVAALPFDDFVVLLAHGGREEEP